MKIQFDPFPSIITMHQLAPVKFAHAPLYLLCSHWCGCLFLCPSINRWIFLHWVIYCRRSLNVFRFLSPRLGALVSSQRSWLPLYDTMSEYSTVDECRRLHRTLFNLWNLWCGKYQKRCNTCYTHTHTHKPIQQSIRISIAISSRVHLCTRQFTVSRHECQPMPKIYHLRHWIEQSTVCIDYSAILLATRRCHFPTCSDTPGNKLAALAPPANTIDTLKSPQPTTQIETVYFIIMSSAAVCTLRASPIAPPNTYKHKLNCRWMTKKISQQFNLKFRETSSALYLRRPSNRWVINRWMMSFGQFQFRKWARNVILLITFIGRAVRIFFFSFHPFLSVGRDEKAQFIDCWSSR